MSTPNNRDCHICGIPLTAENTKFREVVITDEIKGESAFICDDCAIERGNENDSTGAFPEMI